MTRGLAVLTLVVATSASAAPFDKSSIADWSTPPAPTAESPFTPPAVKRTRLANGIALLVIENHKLPIFSMELLVPGAGAASDPKGKPGVAAFAADMLDEGAAGLSAIQIAQEQDRLGASIGVFAGVDAAGVSIGGLTKTIEPTIELVAKIVTQPSFDPKDFERVKGDRGTALELRRDRPREVVGILLASALYGLDSPYGHPSSGLRASFKDISIADVQAFYKTHWDPATMTLVVAGDVDPVALEHELNTSLGAWHHDGSRPSTPKATPMKIAHRLMLVDRAGAAQSDVRIGLVGLDRKDKRYFAFEVLATTLGGGFTSRLNQRLREQLGITYGIRAGMDWRLAPGPFSISTAIVTPETAHGITEAIKIVDDLAATEVPAAELEKSKQNLVRALPAMFDTNAATAAAFAELSLHRLPDDWYASYADAIRKVSATDVKTIARTAIPSGKMVIAIVGDLTKIRADLDKLHLGAPLMHDLYGIALPPK